MLGYHLIKAVQQKKLEDPGYDEINSHDTFTRIVQDIYASLECWMPYARWLIDGRNWNLHNLINPKDGSFRRPQAYLAYDITSRDNLVLEWYPSDRSPESCGQPTDFIYWSDQAGTGISSLPLNRIMMIHDFPFLFPGLDTKKVPFSSQHLVEAIHHHGKGIIDILSYYVNIKLLNDLRLIYEERRLIGYGILTMEEIRARDAEKWLNKTFKETGLTAEEFLIAFKEAEYKKNRLTRILRDRGIKIGAEKTSNIIEKLREEYAGLFLEHCPDYPGTIRGFEGGADVIKFPTTKEE